MEAITMGNATDPILLNDWHVLAKVDEVPPEKALHKQLMEQDIVLWRGADGAIHAWSDRCPHRSVRLSNGQVVENTLVCPYHGMVYGSTGRCIKVPSAPNYVPPPQAQVQTYHVQERYGLVFVCLGEPATEIPNFPEWEDERYLKVISGPHPCQTGGYRAIENFLDVAHFPFLHQDILGDPALPEIEDYEVAIAPDGVHFNNVRVWQPDPMGTGQGSYVTYQYSALRPLTASLRKGNPAGECLTILYYVTPVSEEECIGWMGVAVNYMGPDQADAVVAFQDRIFAQDAANLESHNPKRLPLNPKAEFHTPCDRGSLAYRQWLRQLGVTYGVISLSKDSSI
jgi:phenylpropionate dioxygenase-like ring-hydroxylating dioxygenase large terminal subunit